MRGVVPTVEQTGLDEGYLDIGEVAADFLAARVVAEAVQTAVRAATSLTCSLGVAPCKVVAKVGERRAQARRARRRSVRAGGGVPRAARRAPAARRRAEGRGAAARRRDRDGRRPRRAHATTICAACSRAASARCSATARAASTRVGSSSTSERISISVENTFERDLGDRERLHDELRGMATEVAEHLQKKRPGRAHGDDEASLRRLLDPQPLDLARRRDRRRRRRSATSPAACSTAACATGPGALRLVGVGVSGLVAYRQLALEAV